MKLFYVASPYAGDIEKNVAFAKNACRFVAMDGNAFFAPHLHYTNVLDDSNPEQRKLGLNMGLSVLDRCDELWVFGEKISSGMANEIEYANEKGIPICQISTQEMIQREKERKQGELTLCEMAVC